LGTLQIGGDSATGAVGERQVAHGLGISALGRKSAAQVISASN
jgi:hypothetical protein